MKYDDASWPYEGDFPKDLPIKAGGTHIAMFAVWAWANGLAGDLITNESPGCLESVQARTESPAAIFFRWSDGKLVDEDLSDEGNAFAVDYYLDGESSNLGQYIVDYEEILASGPPTAGGVSAVMTEVLTFADAGLVRIALNCPQAMQASGASA